MKIKMIIKDQKGGALVEFAIALIFLVPLTIGLIEFGLLVYNKHIIAISPRYIVCRNFNMKRMPVFTCRGRDHLLGVELITRQKNIRLDEDGVIEHHTTREFSVPVEDGDVEDEVSTIVRLVDVIKRAVIDYFAPDRFCGMCRVVIM